MKFSFQPSSLVRAATAVLATMTASLALVQPAISATVAARAGLKVMVIGDSISHGHEGDYTWRYRMYQWFQSQGVAVEFVGPWKGTYPPAEPVAPSPPPLQGSPQVIGAPRTYGGYAAGVPDFGGHWALWGRQAAQVRGEIGQMVATYQPDYILMELGFNDMGWFVSGSEGTLSNIKGIVDGARAVKPNVRFAIGNVIMRTRIEGRIDLPIMVNNYNIMLEYAILSWSTPNSPIGLAKLRENFQCEWSDISKCPAGYDGLHPNALGEYQLAKAFSETMVNTFTVGKTPLSVPGSIPARSCGVPSNVKATSGPNGVVVTWDKVYGAMGYNVRTRIKGAAWTEPTFAHLSNRADTTWTIEGLEWEYQIRSSCGENLKSVYSGVVSAKAGRTPKPPVNVRSTALADGVTLRWDPPPGESVVRYDVITYSVDVRGSFLNSVGIPPSQTSATIRGLMAGERYIVAVATWTAAGGGLPGLGPSVRVGRSTPSTPTNLQVWTRDPTTVRLTYTGDGAGYKVWTRNVNNATDFLKVDPFFADGNCWSVGFLFPGVWNYEFCISAFNGDKESGRSTCVMGSKDTAADIGECPPPQQHDGPGWGIIPEPILPGGGGGGGLPGGGGIALPVPQPPDDIWRQDTCVNPSITDASINPFDRWTAVHTSQAWNSALYAWRNGPKNQPFSRTISNFFHLTEQMDCHITSGNNGCNRFFLCDDSYAPAAYLIGNSFVAANNIILNFYDGIGNALGIVTTALGAIADTFNKVPKEKFNAKILLDIVGLGFALAAAPMWNSALKNVAYIGSNPNTLGTIKDSINPIVANGITIAKDAMKPTSFDLTKELGYNLGVIVSGWYRSITDFQTWLFNGNDDTIMALTRSIQGGGLAGTNYSPVRDIDIQDHVFRALYIIMIPLIWTHLSQEKQWPVVIPTGIPCQATYKTDQFRIREADKGKTTVCHDGSIYMLVGASNSEQTCNAGYCNPATGVCRPDVCTKNSLSPLGGMDSINGDNYGKLSKQDIVAASLATYKANGNKNNVGDDNPVNLLDPTNPDMYEGLYEFNIRSPGVVKIPVCKIDELVPAWEKGNRKGNFPCA